MRAVHARVSGSGAGRVLHWSVPRQPGETVTFLEQAPAVNHTIAFSSGGRGSARLVPAQGPGGRRAIVALVTVGGVLRSESRLAAFRAAGTGRSTPSFASVNQRRTVVRVSWGPAADASGYEIDVLLIHGELRRFLLDGAARSVTFSVPSGVHVRRVTVFGLRHSLRSGARAAA